MTPTDMTVQLHPDKEKVKQRKIHGESIREAKDNLEKIQWKKCALFRQFRQKSTES